MVKKGGWPYPYFELASRNESRPDVTCQRDMETMCKVNSTTKRPNIVDKCLLLEFSRVDHKADIGTMLPRQNQTMTDKEAFLTIHVLRLYRYMVSKWNSAVLRAGSGHISASAWPSRLSRVRTDCARMSLRRSQILAHGPLTQ